MIFLTKNVHEVNFVKKMGRRRKKTKSLKIVKNIKNHEKRLFFTKTSFYQKRQNVENVVKSCKIVKNVKNVKYGPRPVIA